MKQKKSETAHIHIFVQMIFDFHYSKVVLQEYSCRGVESQPAVNARVVGAVDMSLCGGHSKRQSFSAPTIPPMLTALRLAV